MRLFKLYPFGSPCGRDQEGLPDYWGIETFHSACHLAQGANDQEGLPDYWGIETLLLPALLGQSASGFDQEGLPAYWGILLVNGNAA